MLRRWAGLTAGTLIPKTWTKVWRIRRWLRERGKTRWKRELPVGWVRFGSLRRLKPIAPDFGWRWGLAIDRYYIEKFLAQHSEDIRGHVLEIEEAVYTRRFGGNKVTRSDVLHVDASHPLCTIAADLTKADNIPSNSFDCIILQQTLEFIYDVRAALRSLYRILKPGGALLVTFHGISQIARYDMDKWGEYWRFTSLSARKLFTEVFPGACVTIEPHGNVLAATAQLQGIVAEELNPEELDFNDPDYEVLIGVRACKPKVS